MSVHICFKLAGMVGMNNGKLPENIADITNIVHIIAHTCIYLPKKIKTKTHHYGNKLAFCSSVGRVSAWAVTCSIPGRDIPKSLKMVLAAPCLALRLTG